MNVLSWILFGLIVGIVANAINPQSEENDVIATTTLGMIGAVLGGLLANTVFGLGHNVPGFNITSFIVAVAGSVTLLISARALQKL